MIIPSQPQLPFQTSSIITSLQPPTMQSFTMQYTIDHQFPRLTLLSTYTRIAYRHSNSDPTILIILTAARIQPPVSFRQFETPFLNFKLFLRFRTTPFPFHIPRATYHPLAFILLHFIHRYGHDIPSTIYQDPTPKSSRYSSPLSKRLQNSHSTYTVAGPYYDPPPPLPQKTCYTSTSITFTIP